MAETIVPQNRSNPKDWHDSICPYCGGRATNGRQCRKCWRESMAEVRSQAILIPDKQCRKCKVVKPKDKFHKARFETLDGLHRWCKSCCEKWRKKRVRDNPELWERRKELHRKWRLDHAEQNQRTIRRGQLRRYGLTPRDFHEMFTTQSGLCLLCGTDRPGGKTGNLHIDHDHETGIVRGLLCANCNTWLGTMEKLIDKVGLDKLLKYSNHLSRQFSGIVETG